MQQKALEQEAAEKRLQDQKNKKTESGPKEEISPPAPEQEKDRKPATMGAAPTGSETNSKHQKMRSIDVQKPLINPWLAQNSHTGKHLTAKNISTSKQAQINLRNQ